MGTKKTYADSVFARPGQLAEDDGDDYKAQIHRMDADGTKSSLAKMMYDILSNPKRQFRLKEHKQKVKERRYHLRPVEAAYNHNVKMKAVGFEKKGGAMVLDHITVSLEILSSD